LLFVLQKYFDIDLRDKLTRTAIERQIGGVWRNTRYEYRKHFRKHKGLEDLVGAKRNCPKGIEQFDWEYLCDMFANSTYLIFFSSLFSLITNFINTVLFVILLDTNYYFEAKCAKNYESRKKRKWSLKNGHFLMLAIMFVLVRTWMHPLARLRHFETSIIMMRPDRLRRIWQRNM